MPKGAHGPRPLTYSPGMVRVLMAGALVAGTLLVATPGPGAAEVAGPEHRLSVTGAGLGIYPTFDPATERFALTTTGETGGAVTVDATTDDPDGTVLLDGRPVSGPTVVTGLEAGDEVSVVFDDSAGREVHSLVYLPSGFPTLEVTTPAAGVAPGQVALTLSNFAKDGPGLHFLAVVDRNGVPAHVEQVIDAYDLKRQPDGRITVGQSTTTPGRTGVAVVVRDDHWREVTRYETVGLVHTDPHDSILLPDGSRFLQAYEANPETGLTDSIIQEVDAAGEVVFEWSSASLAGESVVTRPDYAHLNSMDLAPDGDVVASFRNLSAVLRIATTAHDGFQPGDIVWKLGGRDSDFTFVDDPYGGPCAQHAASLLPNGHVLLFDDGSGGLAGPLCVDPDDPAGPPHERPQSRAAEWALDPEAHTATLVWSYEPPGWYTWFMGSAWRLANGNTLIDWAADPRAIASEVDPSGRLQWELRQADGAGTANAYISYRAHLVDIPDAIEPELSTPFPADEPRFRYGEQVTVDYSCTDTGGSSLSSCEGGVAPGGMLDTTDPGGHVLRLVARDGAGNTTTVRRRYVVRRPPPSYRPDVAVRVPGGGYVGGGVYGGVQLLDAGIGPDDTVRATVRVRNDGNRTERFRLSGAAGGRSFAVRYVADGRPVTAQVVAGHFRTPSLRPGEAATLRLVVTATDRAVRGDRRVIAVRAVSPHLASRRDSAGLAVTVRR